MLTDERPSWALAASKPDLFDTLKVKATNYKFWCPFCQVEWKAKFRRHAGGHRCTCGALFYDTQGLAIHFKGRVK